MTRISRCLLALCAVSPAWSWGPAGHRIVAIIAEQRLSDQAREKVRTLLLDGKYFLPDISSCADEIRGKQASEMCRSLAGIVPPENGTWHYIDIPAPTRTQPLVAFCPHQNCVTARIRSFSEILRSSKDDARRRQALMFLVHFVGDIHQPLHAAERGCDHGGNSEHVNFSPKESNVALHHAWDMSEVELAMKNANITDERFYAGFLMAGIRLGEAARWSQASADDMAWESNKLAVTKVYRGIPLQDFCDGRQPPPLITKLTPAYKTEGTKVVREQLLKAGVRLAAILEADLAGPASGSASDEDQTQ